MQTPISETIFNFANIFAGKLHAYCNFLGDFHEFLDNLHEFLGDSWNFYIFFGHFLSTFIDFTQFYRF